MEPGGTSYPVFGGFPVEIAGKTGTAERPPHGDQSWYVALAPAKDPEIVVAATIEEGGFGADAAAPAVRQILENYFDVKAGQIEDVGDASGGHRVDGRLMPAIAQPRPRPRSFDEPRSQPERPAAPRPSRPAARGRRRRPDRVQRLHAGDDDPWRRSRGPVLLRCAAGDLRRCRDRPDAGPRPHRLLAVPRASRRALYLHHREHRARLRPRQRDPGIQTLDRTSLLHIPAVGAGQVAADARARGLRHRQGPADVRTAADRASAAARVDPGGASTDAAGPGHRPWSWG